MKVNRVCRILLAVLLLCMSVSAVPGRTAAEPWVPVGMIENGVWRLDPANYTYRALQNIRELNLSGKGIRAIEGIEHLSNLTSLNVSYNDLENLDLSKCRKLSELYCSHNRLGALDLTPCTRMKILDCSDNPIGELSVASTRSLQTLNCRRCGLKTLDVSVNRPLTELFCSGNELSAIDVSSLKHLKKLDVADTGLSGLDLSKNDALTDLDVSANPELKRLDLTANRRLRELHTDGTAIDSLDLSSQRGLADAFCSRKGYRYEAEGDTRMWRPEDSLLTANVDATIRIGSEILIPPAGDDLRSRIALPGYRKYKPGAFSKLLLASDYEEMCRYFAESSGSVFRMANEDWFYENAHTVAEKAGLAVGAWWEETDKEKSGALAYTVFDPDGSFRFRCTVEYMANENAVEFAERLNKDHETPDAVDLRGYTGQVAFFACGNALVTMEGIPSVAHAQTPTLESYIMRDPASQLYLIDE